MKLRELPSVAGETMLIGRHASGLTVLAHPRRGGIRGFASVTARFGSLDEQGEGGRDCPPGTAHFLEHELFEDRDGDVALRFSARGASCNAATEYHRTTYHFSGVDAFEENLLTLLKFVLDPWFTADGVDHEREVIAQETRMHDDDPDWRGFLLLAESLYHRHPIRRDIAGCRESIARITPAVLERCHASYYQPANLILTVAGGFDPAELLSCIGPVLADNTGPSTPPLRPTHAEPPAVRRRHAELTMSVSRPQLWLGFKDEFSDRGGAESVRRELAIRMALDLLFSSSSRAHEALERAGLIDDGFDAFYTSERDFGFSTFASDTDEPERLEEGLLETLDHARRDGLDPDDFERHRRRYIGRSLQAFDSSEAVAGILTDCHLHGVHPAEVLAIAGDLSVTEVEERLHHHLKPERVATAVLRPGSSPT